MGKLETLPETVPTKRLILRKPEAEDAGPIFRTYSSDREVTPYLTWQTHKTVEDAQGFLTYCAAEWTSGTSFPYVIVEQETPDGPIGMIHARPSRHGVTMGYVLAKKFWGRGYMTEALSALCELLFTFDDVFRVSAFCDAENIGSARVMEKSGMEFEGVLKRYAPLINISDEPRDCRMYARTR